MRYKYNALMRTPLTEVLQDLRANPRFADRIAAWHCLPARAARWEPLPPELDPRLADALRARGIAQLYAHQAQALAATLLGQDVAVVTGPASGKTLCYNLPVWNALLCDPDARALYLFPTKALAQDQLAAWTQSTDSLLPAGSAVTYDGDTPAAARTRIRQGASVLITNPDMLHVGILPHHTRWQAFFSRLQYVVVDEMHVYRGVFGSHMANLLRRLRRVCELYDARPQFILCSATIANPQELAEQLVERPVTLVDQDASPRGERNLLLYNPPLVDTAQGLRRSLLLESATLADYFLERDLPTIVFSQGRLTTELLLTYLRRSAQQRGDPPGRVRGYRGGYLPRERRGIERGLRSGEVRGVVSTNALELGVDIGELQVCVLAGYPGSIASTWQQAGRAGRRQDVSLAVLVGGPSALDQYLLSHPEFFFSRSPEKALLAADNPFVLRSHLKCAAFELPIRDEEVLARGAETARLINELAQSEGVLRRSGQRWHWMSSRYPAQDVSLRTAGAETFLALTRDGAIIGQVDAPSAPLLIHPGAIYLHEGQAYLVEELDWERRSARVRSTQAEYFTEARLSVKVEVQQVRAATARDAIWRGHGDVRVRSKATGFRQLAWYTHELLAELPLDLPEQEWPTSAYWLRLSDDLVTALRDRGDWTIAPILSYGPDWEAQRRRVRERDRYRCRHCGRPEAAGREHDVHHLQPFRTFDYRPGQNENYRAANVLDNLITLCPDCHRRLESAHAMQGTLDGLATLLRGLAPLHLMCAPRDLGVSAELDFPWPGSASSNEPPADHAPDDEPAAELASKRAPTVILYDAVPGGVGFSAALYALHDTLLQAGLDWLRECPCAEGCPACIGPPLQPGLGAKSRVLALLERSVADKHGGTETTEQDPGWSPGPLSPGPRDSA